MTLKYEILTLRKMARHRGHSAINFQVKQNEYYDVQLNSAELETVVIRKMCQVPDSESRC